MSTIRGLLIDLGGVVYQGRAPLPGALEALGQLRAAGLPYRFLTNRLLSRGRGRHEARPCRGRDDRRRYRIDAIAASRAGLTGWLVHTGKWASGRVPTHADATIAEFDELAAAIAHFLGSGCR